MELKREGDMYLLRSAKLHFPQAEAPIDELTNDKKLAPSNVLALQAYNPVGLVSEDLVLSLLNPGTSKNLRKMDARFYTFFVKALLSKHAHSEAVVSKVVQTLAAATSSKTQDELPTALGLLSTCLSGPRGSGGALEEVGKVMHNLLSNTLKDIQSAKKSSSLKKSTYLARLILSTLRLLIRDETSNALLDESESSIFASIGMVTKDSSIADHALVIASHALSGKNDLANILFHQILEKAHHESQTLSQQQAATSSTSGSPQDDNVCFRTDFARLLGKYLAVQYDRNVEEGHASITFCRQLLLPLASDRVNQIRLEAVKALLCDVHLEEAEEHSEEKVEKTRNACKRSWMFLCHLSEGSLVDLIATHLEALLFLDGSSERNVERASACSAILTMFKCITLGQAQDDKCKARAMALIPALKKLLNQTKSMNLAFIVFKCLLWGGGLTLEPGVTSNEVESRLTEKERIPEFLMLDLITHVSLYLKFARDEQVEETLLLLSMLVRKVPGSSSLASLESAWKHCMQRTELVKAAAIASSLGVLSSKPPADLISRSHLAENAQMMRLKSLEFVAEYLNFALSEYQWDSGPEAVKGHACSKALPGNGITSQREPLLLQALNIFEACLLSSDTIMKRKLISAIQIVSIRSSSEYQHRCYLILKKACTGSTGAIQQVIQQALFVLEDLYDSQHVFKSKVQALGEDPQSWPGDELETAKKLHSEMLETLSSICFIPKHLYLPLGPESRAFLQHFQQEGTALT